MPPPANSHRLPGFEHLEAREVPAASLLADLNTNPATSFEYPFGNYPGSAAAAEVNGVVLFSPVDGANGASIWKSDGTAAGTKLVAALPYAGLGGVPGGLSRPTQFTAVGNKAVFAYDDGARGQAVWATDGTAAGTKLLADPVALGNLPYATLIGAANGKAFFSMSPAAGMGLRLYATDGTAAGTTLVKETGYAANNQFTVAGGSVYFATVTYAGLDQPTTSTIWKSDGTAAGTAEVTTLPAGVTPGYQYQPPGSAVFAVAGDTLYFSAHESTHGNELWAYHPDTGAGRVADLNANPATSPYPWMPTPSGTADSNPQQLVVVGETLYFVADDGVHGQELWSSDGTAAGTVMVADLSPDVGPGSGSGGLWPPVGGLATGSRIAGLQAVDGRLIFSADNGTDGPQLYRSDGTAAGTVPVTALDHPAPPDPNPGYYPYTPPTVVGTAGGRIYFSGHDTGPVFGSTDGTLAGTTLLPAGGAWGPAALGAVGGRLLYTADTGAAGRQLHVTDGTAAGTAVVTRINPGTAGSNPGAFTSLGTTAVFVTGTLGAAGQVTVYATDGTAAPTVLKAFDQPVPGTPAGFGPMYETAYGIVAAGGKGYFVTQVGLVGRQLWVTDGTAAGTKAVKTIDLPDDLFGPNVTFPAGLGNPTAAPGGGLYFTLDLPGVGQQLWKTDGTAAGTKSVATISPRSVRDAGMEGPRVAVGQLTVVGTALYFVAGDDAAGAELWRSDGTAAGTKRVADLAPGPLGSYPTDLVAFNGKVHFVADDGSGRKLWSSDGTAAGTRSYAAVAPPPWYPPGLTGPGSVGALVPAGGKLYFVGRDDAHGQQLWATDGTAAGTRRLSAVNATGTPYVDGMVSGVTAVGSKVFFTAQDAAAGWQLYVSDGTAAGTKMARAIGKGPADAPTGGPRAAPVPALVVGDRLLFSADDGATGRELWVTDGTAAGTRLVQDINPGRRGGFGTSFAMTPHAAVVNGRVLFAGDNGLSGVEVWTMPVTDVAPPAPTPAGKPTLVGTSAVAAVVGVGGPHALATVTLPAGPAYNVWVLWGNGKTTAGTLTKTTADGATFTISGSQAYAAAGSYGVTVRVMGNGKNVLEARTTATVTARSGTPTPPPATGPRPTLVSATRVAAAEGVSALHTLATVKLPAGVTYTAQIAWGDGTTTAGTLTKTTGGAWTVTGTHAYADPGSFVAQVRLVADGQTALTVDTAATVTDSRFYVSRTAQRVTAGKLFSGVVATVQDLNPAGGKASDYTATINWGDGSKSAGTVKKTAAGKFEVVGSFTFPAAAKRTVTVTITSNGGNAAKAESLFTIDPKR